MRILASYAYFLAGLMFGLAAQGLLGLRIPAGILTLLMLAGLVFFVLGYKKLSPERAILRRAVRVAALRRGTVAEEKPKTDSA